MNKYFTRFIFLLFIFFAYSIVDSQSLIPNGGFETYTNCPTALNQFSGKISNWINPNAATPDFMNTCASPNPAGVPKNGIGYQNTYSGSGYVGIYTYAGTTYREFIQVKFSSPLIAGHSYYLTMYVVLHNKSQKAIDDIGAYFSVIAPSSGGTGLLSGSPVPQISNPYGSVISDTLNWKLISGSYIATGGEKYITLGHFKSDASTTYLTLPYGTIGEYYYFDEVSLIDMTVLPVTLLDFSGKLITENLDPLIELNWSTANELNNCCFQIEKSSDGVLFNEIGMVAGAGNSASTLEYQFIDENPFEGGNYYRLKQIDNNGVNDYSEIIFINNTFEVIVTEAWVYGNTLFIYNYSDQVLASSLYTVTAQNIANISVVPGSNEWIIPQGFKGILLVEVKGTDSGKISTLNKFVVH